MNKDTVYCISLYRHTFRWIACKWSFHRFFLFTQILHESSGAEGGLFHQNAGIFHVGFRGKIPWGIFRTTKGVYLEDHRTWGYVVNNHGLKKMEGDPIYYVSWDYPPNSFGSGVIRSEKCFFSFLDWRLLTHRSVFSENYGELTRCR